MQASVRLMFFTLLSSPNIKQRRESLQNITNQSKPLIILLPRVHQLLDVDQWDLLERLRDAHTDAIIISTEDRGPEAPSSPYSDYDCCGYNRPYASMPSREVKRSDRYSRFERNSYKRRGQKFHQDSTILSTIGTNPRTDAICMVPVRTRAQQALFDAQYKSEESYELENIRVLQRSIRRASSKHKTLSLVQPFTKWEFLEGTPTQKKLAKEELGEEEVNILIQAINREVEDEPIKRAILRLGRRMEALDEWCSAIQDKSRESQWSSFSAKAQSAIAKIEDDKESFKWEHRFLDLLINPNDVEEGWSEIALDPEVKDAIVRLIQQPSNTGSTASGILKQGRISGALLYGPPGTGKTHLARVLARESKAVMICVSVADIENKYVGQTEKAIKGLFSLGRMLSPCTIFLDEADSLFRHRGSDDRSWERSRINQLLHEMDGLKTSTTPPFVLLATNFPRDLDHAVLRRAPSRIHIGLPPKDDRIRIFQICLRDELLDADVNFEYLGKKSWRYSGSDIKTVCVQAALICDTFVGGDEPRRLLKQAHFEKAFQRSPATVSKTFLAGVKAFAKEFDPAALEKMAQEEIMEDESKFTSSWQQDRTMGNNYPKISTHQVPTRETVSSKVPYTRTINLDRSNEYCTGRVEEIDSETDRSATGDSEEPYQYMPLKPNSNQIRVLSIEPPTAADAEDDTLLRCTLKNVDLDDWTFLYRLWLPKYKAVYREQKLPDTSKSCLAGWHFMSASLQRSADDPLAADALLQDKAKWSESRMDLSRKFESRLRDNNDDLFEGVEVIKPRFNWGDYIALSYVWGDPGNRRDIRLNGHRFSVTANLYQALIHLRGSFEVHRMNLHVWIDAICINQNDLDERAAQVKKMDSIYSQSLAVRGFLGQPSPELAAELPLLKSYLDAVERSHRSEMSWDKVENMELEDVLWRAMSAISSSPYWERLWTIQEVALAPSMLFCFGQQTFSTREIAHCCFLHSQGMKKDKFQKYINWEDPSTLGIFANTIKV